MYLRKSLEESPIFENEISTNNEGQEQEEESFLSILEKS